MIVQMQSDRSSASAVETLVISQWHRDRVLVPIARVAASEATEMCRLREEQRCL